jgi:hypothetical protein
MRRTERSINQNSSIDGFNIGKVKELNISGYDFTIIKAEIKILKDGAEQNLLAGLKYKSEGIYLLSIKSIAGLEAARVYISKDTVLVNDRIGKKLYFASPSYMQKKYGLDISEIPLIFGDYISSDKNDSLLINCKKGISKTTAKILDERIEYSIECSHRKILSAQIERTGHSGNIGFFFKKFENQNNYVFPREIEIRDTVKNLRIRIVIKKTEFKKIENIDFVPGRNYERVPLR